VRCSKILDDGTQCPNHTKMKSARCWTEWGLCGMHAAQDYPEFYPNAKGHKTGGRHGLINNNIPMLLTISEQC